MGRPRKLTTVCFEFRGIAVSLYRNVRGWWEAGFTVPGRKREKSSGRNEAECRENACEKIRGHLGPDEYAARSDEEAARRILEEHGTSLTEAARFWVSQHSQPLLKATVGELRQTWLEHRKGKKNKKQYHHVRSLECRSKHLLPLFEKRFIASIDVIELTRWQDELEETVAPRTARNIHDAGKDLWKFARKRGYLARDRISAMEQIDRPQAGPGRREIYNPEEMQKLLNAAWAYALPGAIPLATNGFGFIRAEELCRHDPDEPLDKRVCWEDVRWRENTIYVRDEVAKTKEGRQAGLPKNLKQMLRPLRSKGALYKETRLDLAYQKIARRAGIKLKYNALRRSNITYEMLLAKNATEVATKAGNSVAIIESNYRNRNATLAQARKWKRLKPQVAWGSALRNQKNKPKPFLPKDRRAASGRFQSSPRLR